MSTPHAPKGNNHTAPHHRVIAGITRLPYSTLFSLWVLLAALFAVAYALLATFSPANAPPQLLGLSPLTRLGDSIYFSVITATSTGYGDIFPMGFSKALASIQSISALFIFATFVTKLVSQQQEIAVKQMHRLTYEDVFHNTREGLYIIRKDFDRIIDKLERKEHLISEDWEDLAAAYKQGQSLLLEIPDFYSSEDAALYTIDERREQLLMEAVHRTLHRINHLIDACSLAEVDWTAHPESAKELKELLKVVDVVTPLWRESSPYQKHESFETVLRLKERAWNRVTSAIK
ncbi:MAG: potassium channel family protein [Candidatus Peribacteraceae bacterium]|nr:potassium channel family protein [Candidatus Peribacteraceae bacterium]MDD5074310.1 potassium channel family protein [Candidatus Peribacteraceae bacterium]